MKYFFSSFESDHGRSVSFSSDKFPPPELVNARLQHHGDKVPYSPPLAMSNYNMSMPPPSAASKSSSSSTKPPSTTSCTALTLPKTTSANQILSSGSHFGNRRSSHKTAHHRLVLSKKFSRYAYVLVLDRVFQKSGFWKWIMG